MPKLKLNEKQKRFCEEYLIDLNATQAAIRAGYSEKTAYTIGQKLTKKSEVKAYIEEKLETLKNERTADTQEMNSDNKEESEADTIKAEGNASIPEELLNEAKEKFSDEYKFILFSDLEKYDANLNGEKIYTIAIVQEVDSDAIKSRKSEGYMFQGFKTNIDYTEYLSEGDVVCIYGTVGEEQELFGMRWTEISDSAVIACGDACEEYAQDSSDESLEEYFYDHQ